MIKPIILIGAMGCGKTSIGYKISLIFKKNFFDVDNELVKSTGVSITDIFDIEGEDTFRKRETKMLAKLCTLNNIILATGGGIVVKKENRELIKKSDAVIYLKSSVDCLYDRLKYNKTRPLLENVANKKQVIQDIVTAREKLYLECANIVIDVSYKKSYVVVNEVKKILNNYIIRG